MDTLNKLLSERDNYTERAQLAIDIFKIYHSLKERVLYYSDHPEEVVTKNGVLGLIPKARAMFACALKVSGVRYVDMAAYYNLSACRVTQLSLTGKDHCFNYTKELGRTDDIARLFSTRGLIELPFNTKEYIQEQEKFFADIKNKIKNS